VRAEINDASRQVGETAADDVMRAKGGKLKYPLNKTHSTAGDFDRVYEVGDELWVVEVKGGGGALGTRAVGGGVRAEQGTSEYLDSVIEAMSGSSSQEAFEAAMVLQEARTAGKVRYLSVRAPIGTTAGQSALKDVQIGEFVLK
jgi:hypothetical protein